ncbi:MAG: ketopantoate reductase family protein [Clostridia bacterium]|nr:ketopantoate reductase family protein [Clostridia bacterium]
MTKAIRTVHLIGLGAVGGTYGSLLYTMDPKSIRVIVDPQRLDRYQKGTVINGKPYAFQLAVPGKSDEAAELIIVAVKGHHLERAMESMAPFVGDNTLILSLLNGITSEEDLSRCFGREKVLHGFCVGTDAVREQGQVRFSNPGRIVFGEYYPEAAGKAAGVADILSRAGIANVVSSDIRREMWWKFMMNVGINQTSAVLRAPYGVYQTIPEARELMASAAREVIGIAQKEGIPLSEADIEGYLGVIQTLSPEGKTSMLQDVEARRKTEVESFALTVVKLGRKHGIPTPVNEMLYRMIRVIEARAQA